MDRAGAEEGELSQRRFHCPALTGGGELVLGSEAARHAQVLRLSIGAAVELFDGRGQLLTAEVSALARSQVVFRPRGQPRFVPAPARLVLVPCVTKGQKLDDVVRMTSELGVSAIRPAWSQRSVVKGDSESGAKKRERWLRIAVEATRQSEGAWVPEIAAPAALGEVLAGCPPAAVRLCCVERSSDRFAALAAPGSETWLVIGPEGGLAPEDRNTLAALGFRALSLGSPILRAETAAVVGVAMVLSHLRP